ncbi:phosphoglycerate mutase family protein [Pseudoalteromonas tunicata]|uniref:SixA phosphatase family protein n=1 Tax=Pseudoalteromonas tunicata TaxID=314281 RepID=UPI00273E33AD|nr:phosphoglycerate mutase family protein [Pseudoalteromonas tunicata]MDP5213755.1 phosphoglycerate mutase family protein [Pseudoalteromonas tunicata]
MKAFLVVTSLLLGLFSTAVWAKPSNIILIRHAEKQSGTDPLLTEQGQKRAAAWVKTLATFKIEQLFSTKYKRTIATITPIATALNKEVRYYNPAQLVDFKAQLLKLTDTVLVVGHSNTTPQLAGLLSDTEQLEWPETNYNTYYVLTLVNDEYVVELKHLEIE